MIRYKHRIEFIFAMIASGIIFLSACAPTPLLTTGTEAGGTPAQTGAAGFDLAAALEAAGGNVQRLGTAEQPFFNVKGERLSVNGAEIQVFSFPDTKSREAISSLISEDGGTIGTYSMNWLSPPTFWAKYNLIVLYLGTDQKVTSLVSRVLGSPLTALSTGEPPTREAVKGTPGSEAQAISAAIKNLSEALNISKGEIKVVSFEQVDWPDACLGLAKQGEMCAQTITPGWRILLEASGQQYEFHTDLTGENIREAKEDTDLNSGLDKKFPPPVVAAVQKLSDALSVSKDKVGVKSYEAVSWPDSCLGLAKAGEMCLQVITPGYRVHLEAGGKNYEVHTDQRGSNLRIKGLGGTESPRTNADRSRAVMAAVRKLSEMTGANVGDIKVLSSEAVDWPDACLGLAEQGEMCAQMVTPGWRILLETGGEQYEVHSNQTGEQLRLASNP